MRPYCGWVTAAGETLRRFPGSVYLMAGAGPLREDVEAACKKNLQGNFRFFGWVENEQMADYINLCDIVIMASDDGALARVHLETQACGKAILASDADCYALKQSHPNRADRQYPKAQGR